MRIPILGNSVFAKALSTPLSELDEELNKIDQAVDNPNGLNFLESIRLHHEASNLNSPRIPLASRKSCPGKMPRSSRKFSRPSHQNYLLNPTYPVVQKASPVHDAELTPASPTSNYLHYHHRMLQQQCNTAAFLPLGSTANPSGRMDVVAPKILPGARRNGQPYWQAPWIQTCLVLLVVR